MYFRLCEVFYATLKLQSMLSWFCVLYLPLVIKTFDSSRPTRVLVTMFFCFALTINHLVLSVWANTKICKSPRKTHTLNTGGLVTSCQNFKGALFQWSGLNQRQIGHSARVSFVCCGSVGSYFGRKLHTFFDLKLCKQMVAQKCCQAKCFVL